LCVSYKIHRDASWYTRISKSSCKNIIKCSTYVLNSVTASLGFASFLKKINMATLARPMTLVPLVYIQVKAHKDYDPR
jgi:hypothetical protein